MSDMEAAKKTKQYSRIKNRLMLTGIVIQFGGVLLLWGSGLTFVFRDWALVLHPNACSVVFLYFVFFSLFFLLVDLPLDYYSGFIIEQRYGLSKHTLGSWAWDQFKKRSLGFSLCAVFLELLYVIMRTFPDQWWLLAWGAWIFITVVLAKIAHLVILPLFYKCEPLAKGELKDKLILLLERHQYPVEDVYSLNLGKTTRKANAAFTGLGKTRRILIADTMLESFTDDEIKSVLAHELGHAVRRHMLRSIVFNSVTSLGVFFLSFWIMGRFSGTFGFESAADVAAFPMLAMVSLVCGLILMPVGNMLSRRHEWEADNFALKEIEDRSVFAAALKKLGEINLADFDPNPLLEFLFHSHPSLSKRIEHAQAI